MEKLLVASRFNDVVREVDEELGEAALGGGVIAQDRGKGCVSERLWKALSKGLAGTGVVTQANIG